MTEEQRRVMQSDIGLEFINPIPGPDLVDDNVSETSDSVAEDGTVIL